MSNTQIVIGPNASLTPAQGLLVMASMSFVSLTIAVGFAVLGFWPILPFAGLELAALGGGLWVSLKRNRYREVLEFGEERVQLSFGWMGRGATAQIEWPRSFTRVALERGGNRNSPSKVVLMSSGQRIVVGRCLTDAEREKLYGRIKNLLPPVWVYQAVASADQGRAKASAEC